MARNRGNAPTAPSQQHQATDEAQLKSILFPDEAHAPGAEGKHLLGVGLDRSDLAHGLLDLNPPLNQADLGHAAPKEVWQATSFRAQELRDLAQRPVARRVLHIRLPLDARVLVHGVDHLEEAFVVARRVGDGDAQLHQPILVTQVHARRDGALPQLLLHAQLQRVFAVLHLVCEVHCELAKLVAWVFEVARVSISVDEADERAEANG
mmetsp:Transcript_70152/g.186921  ORF Transcript_70152/g.186921 Transcript_70152/m.186921 type:complete len:208 (-) Transcript_70152:2856-3479(-)